MGLRGPQKKEDADKIGWSRGDVDVPGGLDAVGKAEFKRVWSLLEEREIDCPAFSAEVEAMARCWSKFIRNDNLLMKEGDIIDTRNGPKKHPAAQSASNALAEYNRMARDFGMTPSHNMRIDAKMTDKDMATNNEEDSLDSFISDDLK